MVKEPITLEDNIEQLKTFYNIDPKLLTEDELKVLEHRGLTTKAVYQVIFCQGAYSKVDYETENYAQALEVMSELQAEMYMLGERNFNYIIKTKEVHK